MEAKEKFDAIMEHINKGGAVMFVNYAKAWILKKKDFDKFEKVGLPLLKVAGNSLYMARGRKYDCMDYCGLRFSK